MLFLMASFTKNRSVHDWGLLFLFLLGRLGSLLGALLGSFWKSWGLKWLPF